MKHTQTRGKASKARRQEAAAKRQSIFDELSPKEKEVEKFMNKEKYHGR